MNIEVRLARVEDAEAIARIMVGTWRYAYAGLMPDELLAGLSIEDRIAGWQRILANPSMKATTLVAERDGVVVGMCGVGQCRDDDMGSEVGELWAIYVAVDAMGQGVGSALEEVGMSNLRDRGFSRATLWVLTSNDKSIAWYEHRGWRAEGRTKTVEKDGFPLHESRYVKDL